MSYYVSYILYLIHITYIESSCNLGVTLKIYETVIPSYNLGVTET